MVEVKYKDAKYYYSLNLNLVIKQGDNIIIQGNKSNPEVAKYLDQAQFQYYIKQSKTHRFYKYLTGQIFVGYFCAYVFGAISLMFLSIMLFAQALPVIPFVLGTGAVSWLNYKIARKAQKRLTKSLDKKKRFT